MDRTMTLQATVDDEFRTELMADPANFDTVVVPLPEPIEQPDQESLEFWTKGTAGEIYSCPSTQRCVQSYHCFPTY